MKDGVAVIASIGDDCRRRGQTGEKLGNSTHIGGLSGREEQSHRQAILIDDGVDFRAQSSTRTANGVIRAPFFPPAAC